MNDGAESAGHALVVDDDAALRRDYSRILRSMGFEVSAASDGREAVGMVHAGAFDVVVSDISMPHMGGIALLHAVRGRDLDVPVILMTGRPDFQTAVEAIEYGAFRYLVKPVPTHQFEHAVRQATSLHKMAKLKRAALALVAENGSRQLGDRAALEVRFESALEKLWIAFQPIVDWPARSVFAYEALMRSTEPTLANPLALLESAERLGRLHELGRRIRQLIAATASEAPPDALLFINLHSLDLGDDDLFAPTSVLAPIAHRVVLEITERASLDDVQDLAGRVDRLRELGFRIAVDDLGAGYAGLSTFTQLQPEFAKLDMSLVRGVDASEKKRSVVRAMSRLCSDELSIRLICEGVETEGERDVLANDGCALLQGYWFAKPARGFTAPRWSAT